jgi:hypothetical protein
MANLDPNIILGGQAPPAAPNPIAALSQIEDVRAQIAQRQAMAENTLSLAQQRITAAKNTALANAAIQAANGDPDVAASALDANGHGDVASALRVSTAKQRSDAEAAIKAHLDGVSATLDTGGRILNVLRDTPTVAAYTPARNALLGMAASDPNTQKFLSSVLPDPSTVTDADIPKIVDAVSQAGQSSKDRLAQLQDLQKMWADGDHQQTIARALTIAKTPQEQQAQLALFGRVASSAELLPFQQAVARGASPQEIEALGGVKPELVAAGSSLLDPLTHQPVYTAPLTPQFESKSVLLDGKPAEVRFDARTGRYTDATGNDVSARVRPIPPQSASTIMLPGSSDTVQGYMQDVLSGSKKLSDVPASGGTRNSVVAELHKEGYDISRPLTAQSQARVEFAKAVIPQVQQVVDLAHQIDAAGLTGTIGGRFRQLASKESSAASLEGLTPDQKRLVGQFVTKSGLLMSGIAMVHGGARGGGSTQMLEQLKPLLNPGNKDLQTYLGNLDAAHDVLTGYSNMDTSSGGSNAPPGVTTGGSDAAVTVRVKGPNGQTGRVPSTNGQPANALPRGWVVVP